MLTDLNDEGVATLRRALLTARRVWRVQASELHVDERWDEAAVIDADLAIVNNIISVLRQA